MEHDALAQSVHEPCFRNNRTLRQVRFREGVLEKLSELGGCLVNMNSVQMSVTARRYAVGDYRHSCNQHLRNARQSTCARGLMDQNRPRVLDQFFSLASLTLP